MALERIAPRMRPWEPAMIALVIWLSAQDDLINDNFPDERYVYGVHRPCKHCSWQTFTGVPILEMAWAPGEPNGSGRDRGSTNL